MLRKIKIEYIGLSTFSKYAYIAGDLWLFSEKIVNLHEVNQVKECECYKQQK